MTRIPSRSIRPFSLAAAVAGLIVLLIPAPHVLAKLAPVQQTAPVPVVTNIPVAAPEIRPVIDTVVKTVVNANVHAVTDATAAAKPSPAPVVQDFVAAGPEPEPQANPQSESAPQAAVRPHADYIDQMKAAGYDVDLDKLIAMKIQNVTPEYARAMANAGFGKPSADDLIACKIQGVTPEYIAQLKQQGFELKSIQDAISFRIFGVTPEFVSAMKAAGFDGLTTKQLLAMRIQGVTPEFARTLKQKFPHVTAEDLIKARIFRIDDEFIAQAEKHGFNNLPFDKLVQLRISGIFDDESVKP